MIKHTVPHKKVSESTKYDGRLWKPIIKGICMGVIATASAFVIGGSIAQRPNFIHVHDIGNGEIAVNASSIRWVQKKNDCMYVCAKQEGCLLSPQTSRDTFKICKDSVDYVKLSKMTGLD